MMSPPKWAEKLLLRVVRSDVRDPVVGDLLEQYRASVQPKRGRSAANRWYVQQVLDLVTRVHLGWASILVMAVTLRTAVDWLVPTSDFGVRAEVSTFVVAATILSAGFWRGVRTGFMTSGAVAGLVIATIAAAATVPATALLYVVVRSKVVDQAIAASGGLAEAFTLPLTLVVPAILLGAVGGVFGALSKQHRRVTFS